MPCYTEPDKTEETLLCKVCRTLTKEKMASIYAPNWSRDISLIEWYAEHLVSDYNHNYQLQNKDSLKLYEDELKRLGLKLVSKESRVTKHTLYFTAEEI